jgi:replicative DNA helicase
MTETRPLHSYESEFTVVGAALQSSSALSAAVEMLRPADFSDRQLRTAFRAIRDFDEQGQAVDPAAVRTAGDDFGWLLLDDWPAGSDEAGEMAAVLAAVCGS